MLEEVDSQEVEVERLLEKEVGKQEKKGEITVVRMKLEVEGKPEEMRVRTVVESWVLVKGID